MRSSQQAQYNKSPNPKLELMTISTEYGITINSRETQPILKNWEMQYCQLIEDNIIPYINKLILYPELSPSGRLHYHGTVTFKTYDQILTWYLKGKNPEINIMITTIREKEVWTKYITKQQLFWHKIKKTIRKKLTNSLIKKIAKPITNRQILTKSILDHLGNET